MSEAEGVTLTIKTRDECSFDGSIITMCASLEAVVEDQHKKGLVMLRVYANANAIGSSMAQEPSLVRTILIAKNGAYRKSGLICNNCPFCGIEIYRNQPWQRRLKR